MPLSVFVGSDEFAVTSASVFVGGAWKTVRRIEAWNGSAWKVVKNFAPAMTASVNRTEVYGSSTEPSGGFITSEAATCTPSGGLAPYTYAWANVGGAVASAGSPTFATSTFTAYTGPSDSIVSQFQCTVTDSLGQTATASVSANFSNFSPL